jgi:hypothetical protein
MPGTLENSSHLYQRDKKCQLAFGFDVTGLLIRQKITIMCIPSKTSRSPRSERPNA